MIQHQISKTPSTYFSTKKENRLKVSLLLTIYNFFNKILKFLIDKKILYMDKKEGAKLL